METRENLIFGRRPVLECLRAGRPINRIYVLAGGEKIPGELFRLAKQQQIPVVRSQRQRLDAMVGKRSNHQGVVAQTASGEFVEFQELLETAVASPDSPFFLALDGVQDPGNFGALLRTAEGAGCHGVIVSSRGSCGLTPAVARASAGADQYIKVARLERLDRQLAELVSYGYTVVAADPKGEVDYDQAELSGPMVVVLGAEGRGLQDRVLESCSLRVKLPLMGQIDSLNVAAAGAVLLYECLRQRRRK